VQRAVEKTGYADYWELVKRGALPRETSNYVPVILAMLLLDKNAEAFHLDDIVPEDPIAYDTVQTDSRIGLSLIADAADTSVSEIKRLNPALLGESTPDGPYSLRIPKDTAEEFEREIAAVPEERRSSWRRHRVLEGETLSQIAGLYRVKVQDIIQVNQLGDEPLRAGERLTIPVPPAPVVRRAGLKGTAGASRTGHPAQYRVKPGDSLGSIAQRYHVSVAELQAWNHLKGVRLIAGQTLNVHTVSPTPVASAGRVTRRSVTKVSQTRRAALPGGRTERTRTLVAATAAN
jgi:membrane-bound lytic murein transglycosylase D